MIPSSTWCMLSQSLNLYTYQPLPFKRWPSISSPLKENYVFNASTSVSIFSSVILLYFLFFKPYSNMRRDIVLSETQTVLDISLLVNPSAIRFSINYFGNWNLIVLYPFGGEKLPNVEHSIRYFIINLWSFIPSFSKSSIVNLHTMS